MKTTVFFTFLALITLAVPARADDHARLTAQQAAVLQGTINANTDASNGARVAQEAGQMHNCLETGKDSADCAREERQYESRVQVYSRFGTDVNQQSNAKTDAFGNPSSDNDNSQDYHPYTYFRYNSDSSTAR